MKKTAKTPQKNNPQKKNTHQKGNLRLSDSAEVAAGAAQNVKKKKTKPAKTSGKRKKNKFSNALHAFLLVGVLIVLSVCISLAVIMVRSSIIKMSATDVSEYELPQEVAVEPVSLTLPESESTNPANPVMTQQPVREQPAAAPAQTTSAQNAPTRSTSTPVNTTVTAVPQSLPERPVENLGTLVFVIDDAGNNLRELEPFLRIPAPLTIAVLPGLPYSAEAARRIRAVGKEVFLHQPMEAIGAQNPGPGAIYSGMSASEIRSILERNVAEVGPVIGINNHQGSKITMDSEAVETILAFCAENNLHFLDSRTTAESIVPAVARKMGIQIAERNVFIDNEPDKDSMLHYISTALTRAQRYGSAVMIGHTWSEELAPLLAEQIPLYVKQGYKIKTASDIIMKR